MREKKVLLKSIFSILTISLSAMGLFAQSGLVSGQQVGGGSSIFSDPNMIAMAVIVLYTYLVFTMSTFILAKKLEQNDNAWWAFVPFLNVLLLLQLSKNSLKLFPLVVFLMLLFVISSIMAFTTPDGAMQSPIPFTKMAFPFVLIKSLFFISYLGNLAIFSLIGIKIAKLRNMKVSWGILMAIIPFAGFPVLAFSKPLDPA